MANDADPSHVLYCHEGDKFHMVIFDDDKYDYEHVETIGAKNEKEFFAVLRKLENDEI